MANYIIISNANSFVIQKGVNASPYSRNDLRVTFSTDNDQILKIYDKSVNNYLLHQINLDNDTVDVVISNCVLNLVPDKSKAFAEIYRILKPGAHFCVSDIVLKGELPAGLKKSAEMYAGCVAGALQQDEYLGVIKETGFTNIEIKRTKVIELPDEVLVEYLSDSEVEKFKQNNIGIFSITVVGYKK